MEQMKYRIKVEVIEGAEIPEDEMPSQQMLDGFECDGFALLLNKGRARAGVALHKITILDLGRCMKGESSFQAAAEIAKILEDADKKRIPDFLQQMMVKRMQENG